VRDTLAPGSRCMGVSNSRSPRYSHPQLITRRPLGHAVATNYLLDQTPAPVLFNYASPTPLTISTLPTLSHILLYPYISYTYNFSKFCFFMLVTSCERDLLVYITICYLLFAICYLLFAICHLLFAICYLLFAICYLLFAISYSLFPILYFVFLIFIRYI